MSAEFDNFYENAGIVHLHNEEGFGDRESFFVIKYLLFLHSTLPADKPIIMMIHARGSTCFSYQAIIAIMDQIKASRIIVTVALGVAKSGGFMVLANGSKGYRYASPYSILMFHNVQISPDNNNRDLANVRNKMEETDLLENIICINLAKNSTCTTDGIRELIEKNCYLTTTQAKEMGFIDGIYDDKLPIAFPFFPAPIKQVDPAEQDAKVQKFRDQLRNSPYRQDDCAGANKGASCGLGYNAHCTKGDDGFCVSEHCVFYKSPINETIKRGYSNAK